VLEATLTLLYWACLTTGACFWVAIIAVVIGRRWEEPDEDPMTDWHM
jgi:hypothetical protein